MVCWSFSCVSVVNTTLLQSVFVCLGFLLKLVGLGWDHQREPWVRLLQVQCPACCQPTVSIFFVSPHGIAMVVVSSAFLMPNRWGYWTDVNQTWTHIHLWLLFEKFGLNSPGHLPQWAGGKHRFFGTDFDRKYFCNETWYQQLEKMLSICRDSLHAPKI